MGQVPAKNFLPAAPVGASSGANTLNQVQPIGTNPQQPLLPPNFQSAGNTPMPQQPSGVTGLLGGTMPSFRFPAGGFFGG